MAVLCVYCSSSAAIPQHYLELAAGVGAELARRGHSLVSGGGAVSMMGAVARAARDGGAHTTGVIPEGLMGLEVADHDADELVVTATMRERKAQMDQRSDGFLALPGGIGTLEELLEVWTSRTLGMHEKPVVVLDPDDFYSDFRRLVDGFVLRGFAGDRVLSHLTWTRTVSEALDAFDQAIGAGRPAR